jgi:hypothetical protein
MWVQSIVFAFETNHRGFVYFQSTHVGASLSGLSPVRTVHSLVLIERVVACVFIQLKLWLMPENPRIEQSSHLFLTSSCGSVVSLLASIIWT